MLLLRAVVVLLVCGVLVPGSLRACAPAPDGLPAPMAVRTTMTAPVLRVPVGLLAPSPGEALRLLVVEVAAP
ncbi:hypothetical protein ACUN7V_12110 [Quadrisphaera oryzae]|uniref:hypothetical protein n=1 Tax=Quadrisphaera TaxID=317661 RepID=UPI001648918A|nr:hypothetical protein [Quadrisphaera sp. RL12-1S]MBC3763324.1 hypothetical protein [Quadrisphaera sp. RL12-1S]